MNEYIQVMLVSVMIATLISFGIQVWTLLSLKGDMSDTAVELARFIELHGAVDSEVYDEFDRLKHVTGAECDLDIDGDYYSGSKLQLEAPFTVTVTSVGHLFKIPVHLNAKATGRSEVYHK